MSNERVNEPDGSEALASDPPNNTEPGGANLSAPESDKASPSDPPNNT